MNDLTKLVTFLKNWWEAIKSHEFKVTVENQIEIPEFPEIPEVKIPEYPTEIKVSNLDQIKPIDKFADIVKAIEKQSKALEPDDKNIVNELKAILKELQKEENDLTPEVITKISELIKSVDSKSIDFSVLEKGIKDLYDLIDYVKEYDEIKVKLNGSQFKALASRTATAIASGTAGGAKETTLQKLIGFEIPPYDTKEIDTTDPNSIVITFYKDSSVVATKTIETVGPIITITRS